MHALEFGGGADVGLYKLYIQRLHMCAWLAFGTCMTPSDATLYSASTLLLLSVGRCCIERSRNKDISVTQRLHLADYLRRTTFHPNTDIDEPLRITVEQTNHDNIADFAESSLPRTGHEY